MAVRLSPRGIAGESPQSDGDWRVFDTADAVRINRARIALIASLGLPLSGARLLDVGCGVGNFVDFYRSQGCEVVALDGRAENIAELRCRHPDIRAVRGDIESFDLRKLGRFDVVHCLGLLYHLENPLAALRNIYRICDRVLVLETMVVDSRLPVLVLADETKTVSQALNGLGCRLPHVYGVQAEGEHEDFGFEWRDDGQHTRNGHPLRCMFVASHKPLVASRLASLVG
jgi:SAM-dependent methyltransferase